LLLGLGGGTQAHLLRRQGTSGIITVVEQDPVIVRVASEWFGLRTLGGLEILCTEVGRGLAYLTRSGRRFDYVMDDISYAAPAEEAARIARQLAHLVAPGGTLVLNQHLRAGARAVAAAVSILLPSIRTERVRRGAENVLVFASRCAGSARSARTVRRQSRWSRL
jgi:spermidine synthase